MLPIGPILAGLAAAVPAVLDHIPDADPVKARARREGQLVEGIARLTRKLEGDLKPARRARLAERLAGLGAELRVLRGGSVIAPPRV